MRDGAEIFLSGVGKGRVDDDDVGDIEVEAYTGTDILRSVKSSLPLAPRLPPPPPLTLRLQEWEAQPWAEMVTLSVMGWRKPMPQVRPPCFRMLAKMGCRLSMISAARIKEEHTDCTRLLSAIKRNTLIILTQAIFLVQTSVQTTRNELTTVKAHLYSPW